MRCERCSGILLHPTSLPGAFGIGDLGPQAYRWIDWLAGTGCKLWQVLPLGPTGYGDSPYQCFSAFAGNPYLISPELLLQDDLLHANDLVARPDFPEEWVDYGMVIPWKLELLERAYLRFYSRACSAPDKARVSSKHSFEAFCSAHATWLEDYALFMAIKEAHDWASWEAWPQALRTRERRTLAEIRENLREAMLRFKFYQYMFFRQWSALRKYAAEQGILIIGDVPLFMAYDSADVWAHPELFILDKNGRLPVVAGVPPDYFSPTGQLWGNPLYDWQAHKASGYAWWLQRIQTKLEMVDMLRLDHFRGFAGYWEIPAGNPTAEIGRWVRGPGKRFFRVVINALKASQRPDFNYPAIIAEDLGVVTPDVVALRQAFNLPGMNVLQFAFTGMDNPFLPHNISPHCVVYTGTHDNDTAWGWYRSAPQEQVEFARRYLNVDGSDFAWDLIRAAWASAAIFALALMQDFLNLGSEARMNYPSRAMGNWQWRIAESALSSALRQKIHELNLQFTR